MRRPGTMSEGERWGTGPPSGLTESRLLLLLAGWLEDPGQQPFSVLGDCRLQDWTGQGFGLHRSVREEAGGWTTTRDGVDQGRWLVDKEPVSELC